MKSLVQRIRIALLRNLAARAFGIVELVWVRHPDGSEGNVPVTLLDYSTHWEDTEDQLTFVEERRWKDTGEIAKRSVHIMLKKGLSLFGEQGRVS